MTLTKAQKRKLAKAARELAMECVAGTAPSMTPGVLWDDGPGCAMGQLAAKIGAVGHRAAHCVYNECPFPDRVIVADASDTRPDALPWALLSLADELEA